MSSQQIHTVVSALLVVFLLTNGFTPPALIASSPAALAPDKWAVQLGTAGTDSALDLALAPNGNVIVVGQTSGDLAAPNAGGQDAWVAAFDAEGQRLWLHQYGGEANEAAMAVAVDDASNIYVSLVSKPDANDAAANTTLLALDAAGDERWTLEYPGMFGAGLTAAGAVMYLAGRHAVAVEEDDEAVAAAFVTAVSQSGATLWESSIQDGPGVGVTGIAVNGETIALAGVWDPGDWEPGSRLRLRGGSMWAATLTGAGELGAIELSNPADVTKLPSLADKYYALAPAVSSANQPGSFAMVGAGDERGIAFDSYGATIGWLAYRDPSNSRLWQFNDFATSEESTVALGVSQLRTDRFIVTGLQNAGTTPSTSSALIALSDESGYFDWVTGFGIGVSNITRPAVDAFGYIYVAGGATGPMVGPNLGEADIWLAKIALNEVGTPQFPPELAQGGQRPINPTEATAMYDNLAGTIVFLANLETADNEDAAGRDPHYVYAVQPDGSRLAQISSRSRLNWAGAAVSPDGKYVALSSVSAQVNPSTAMISIVDPQGNAVHVTDHPPGSAAFPLAWSPDGRSVLYLVFQESPEGLQDNVIFALDIPALTWTQLTPLDDVSDWDAVWTPDGKQIVYESNGFHIMNRDGSDPRLLFDPAKLGYPRRVALSPDGRQLATTPASYQFAGNWDIWIADLDGENARNLTNTPDWEEENAAWSPDGRFIVYDAIPVYDDDPIVRGAPRIFIHDVTTGERRMLVEAGSSVEPQWLPGESYAQNTLATGAPSGDQPETAISSAAMEQLVFIHDAALWSVQADGGQLVRLTDPDAVGSISSYTWKPDGDELAFVSDIGLWRQPPDSTIAEQLLDGAAVGDILQAAWSPDGASIALIAAQDDNDPSLYLLELDGSPPLHVADRADGALAWAGPYLVLTLRGEGDPDRAIVFETKLRIIDPRYSTPREMVVSGGWEMPYTEPGRTPSIDVSADQRWIQFDDLGVRGLASVSGAPVADAPAGHWKGEQSIVTYFKADRNAGITTLYGFDPATGEEKELGVSHEYAMNIELARFSLDGQFAAVSTDEIDLLLPDGSLRPLVDHTAGAFQWSPTGKLILYLRTIQHPQALATILNMYDMWLDRAGYFVVSADGTYKALLLPSSASSVTWRPRPYAGWLILDPPLVAPDGTYTLRFRSQSEALIKNPWLLFGPGFATAESVAAANITDIELAREGRIIADPSTIREVLYLYVAAHQLYRAEPVSYFSDLDNIDESLNEVLNYPLLMAPGLGTILQGEEVRRREAWRAVIGKSALGSDLKEYAKYFADELMDAVNVGEAAVMAAQMSDKAWVHAIAQGISGPLDDWAVDDFSLTIKGQFIPIKVPWLDVAQFLVEIFAVDYLSGENVALVERSAELFAASPDALTAEQSAAFDIVKQEVADLASQREDAIDDFALERFADIFQISNAVAGAGTAAVAAEAFANVVAQRYGSQHVAAFLSANLGQIVSGGLLGLSAGSYLMGLDELYDQFVLASEVNDLRKQFQQARTALVNTAPDSPIAYDAASAEQYLASLRLEMLAATQVRLSYINGVSATTEKGAASPLYLWDQLQGGEWEQAVQGLRNETQGAFNALDEQFIHRPAIESLVNLMTQRIERTDPAGIPAPAGNAIAAGEPIVAEEEAAKQEAEQQVEDASQEPPAATLTVLVDKLNVRSGPGTSYQILGQANTDDALTVVGRNAQGTWLAVCCTAEQQQGWVIAAPAYVNYAGTVASLPVVEAAAPAPPQVPPAAPAANCSIAAAGSLAQVQQTGNLGCATNLASITWAAYTPFEGGFILWRRDTQQIYGFFADGAWLAVPDSWDGSSPIPSRGVPPAGRLEPVRGAGWVWGTNDDFFNRLRWGTGEQTGFCAEVQTFENGFALRSSTTPRCDADNGNPVQSDQFLYLAAQDNGAWIRR